MYRADDLLNIFMHWLVCLCFGLVLPIETWLQEIFLEPLILLQELFSTTTMQRPRWAPQTQTYSIQQCMYRCFFDSLVVWSVKAFFTFFNAGLKIIKKTRFPHWGETLELELDSEELNEEEGTITVEVWDWDMVGKNDFLGKVCISPISCHNCSKMFPKTHVCSCSCLILCPWLFFLSTGGNPFCLFAQDTSVRGLVSFVTLGEQWGRCWVRIMGVLVFVMWPHCVFVKLKIHQLLETSKKMIVEMTAFIFTCSQWEVAALLHALFHACKWTFTGVVPGLPQHLFLGINLEQRGLGELQIYCVILKWISVVYLDMIYILEGFCFLYRGEHTAERNFKKEQKCRYKRYSVAIDDLGKHCIYL